MLVYCLLGAADFAFRAVDLLALSYLLTSVSVRFSCSPRPGAIWQADRILLINAFEACP
jgi:hypothetical protein